MRKRSHALQQSLIAINQEEERNPFPKALYTPQQGGITSENIMGYSNAKNVNQNYAPFTSSKVDNPNLKGNLSMIYENKGEQSGIFEKNRVVTKTTTTTNINTANLSNIGVNRGRVEETFNNNAVNNLNNAGHTMNSILNNNIPSTLNINSNAESNMNMNTKSMNTITTSSNISGINNFVTAGNNIATTTSSMGGINNFGTVGNTQSIQETKTVYHKTETSIPGQTTQ